MWIKCLAEGLMRYYPKRFAVYYYPGQWIQYKSCTHSAHSQLPGEHSGQAPLQRRTHATSIKRQITFASYRVPIYTPGWRAAMWIKCLTEGMMRYYPKRFTVYYYPGHWFQYKSCTHSAPSQLPGEHSGQARLQGRTHGTTSDKLLSHLTGYPFKYTWVESSDVDKVCC